MLAQSHKPYQNDRHTLSTWTLFGLSLHINRFACGFECSCYNLTNIYTSTTSLDFILAFVCSYVRMFAETLLNCCDHLHPSYFILLCYPYLSSTPTFGGVDLASIYSLFILCGFFRRLLFELPFIFVWCRTLYLSICVLFQFWWFLLAVCRFCFCFCFILFFFIFRCARIFSFEHSSCVSEWTADGLVWQKVNVCSIIIEYVELQSAEHWCSGFNSFLFVFISANIQRKFL